MKLIIIGVVAAVAIGAWFVFSGGEAKPGPAAKPTVGLVEGIQTQFDFKAKASLALKIETQWNAAKQLMAMDGGGAESRRNAMDSYAELTTEVAAARSQLKVSGMSDADIDAWLEQNHWGELQKLIAALKEKPAQQ